MNVAFFLTPKAEVAWVKSTSTLRQAIERMEHHKYTAIPVLLPDGTYAGTLTEGDLLWFMKRNPGTTFANTGHVALNAVERRLSVRPVHIDANVEQLVDLALDQNFVPVVDDRDVFIGIVRRRSILEFFHARMASLIRDAVSGPQSG